MQSAVPSDAVVAFCSCPDQTTAEELARGLVEKGWSACVQIMPLVTSIYVWQGELCQENEVLLVIKTAAEIMPKLTQWLIAQHPYDLPEVIAVPVVAGASGYIDWLLQNSRGNDEN